MREREFRRRCRALRDSGVVCDALSRPERKPQSWLEFEEGYRSMLEFRSDNPLSREPKTVVVEREGPFQVVDSDRDHGVQWFHAWVARDPALANGLSRAKEADNEVAPHLIEEVPPEVRFVLGDLHYNVPMCARSASQRVY